MAPVAARPRREPRSEDFEDDVVPVWLSRWEAISRLGYDRLAAGLLALIAAGTLLWALALQSRLDDRGEEIRTLREQVEQQQSQLAQVRGRPDVTMLNVSATQEGPETARGTLFYAPGSGQGTLTVSGLPAPPEGKVYQLWYIGNGRPVPEPGGTFTVDEQGTGILPITGEVPPFQQVGITVEPEGGSQTPTLPVVAIGANG
ncbi:MAG: anti-sigma factor [Chloroflexota bacterium]|nr:anti-sigma factor [Chloroflexota bacterium]